MSAPFQHRQFAHCESGVASAMLSHYGLPISEPMAFGLASALAFAYIPLIKLSGMPLIGYRTPPRAVLRGLQKRLGVKMVYRTFRDPASGMAELDQLLAEGRVVGLQTSVFWLPYFPEGMRFHFNAHNLIVFGREQDQYRISDPVFEQAVDCSAAALQKARFAKGALAARGLLYYPAKLPAEIDYPRVIPQAIRANYRIMVQAPLPVIGIRGIRYLARCVVKLGRSQQRDRYLRLYLAHIVRMQEEIGTGGAGFRFIYASFLQESARLLASDMLAEASRTLTDAGDEWRRFALHATKMSRGRETMDVDALATILNHCADLEAGAWQMLRAI